MLSNMNQIGATFPCYSNLISTSMNKSNQCPLVLPENGSKQEHAVTYMLIKLFGVTQVHYHVDTSFPCMYSPNTNWRPILFLWIG